jgi:hypothetical protein
VIEKVSSLSLAAAVVLVLRHSAAADPRWRLSAEGGVERDLVGDTPHALLGADLALPLAGGRLEAMAGLRLVTGRVSPDPAAGFAAGLSVCARHGVYRPALGLELEARTPYHSDSVGPAPDSLTRAYESKNSQNVVFARVVIEPARVSWGRLFVAAGSLRFGTPVGSDAGRRLQVGITLLKVGFNP